MQARSLGWKIPWRRAWQSTPVSLPGKSNSQKILVGCRLLLLSHFSCVQLCATPQTAAHQAPASPWDSPGKNTGVGCHFLLQCMKVKSESDVAQSCPTLSDPMDCSLPGSSVHGIFQARVLEWGAIAFGVKTLPMFPRKSGSPCADHRGPPRAQLQ